MRRNSYLLAAAPAHWMYGRFGLGRLTRPRSPWREASRFPLAGFQYIAGPRNSGIGHMPGRRLDRTFQCVNLYIVCGMCRCYGWCFFYAVAKANGRAYSVPSFSRAFWEWGVGCGHAW